MSGAAIGLLGIFAGALVGSVVALRADRRVRRVRAVGIAMLIEAEIAIIADQLENAAERSAWWPGTLPADRWCQGAADIAFDVTPSTVGEVSGVYAEVADWNARRESVAEPRTQRASSSKPTASQVKELRQAAGVARDAGSSLERDRTTLQDRRFRERLTYRLAAFAVVLVLIVVGLLALFVHRPSLTDASVSDAIARQLGPGHLVACERVDDGWTCLDHATSGCGYISNSSLIIRPESAVAATDVRAHLVSCEETTAPTALTVVPEGSELVVSSRQAGQRTVAEVHSKTDTWWDRFWAKVAGSD